METSQALSIFSALAQDMRLQTVRLLIEAEPQGLSAGEIAERLDARQNTLSANLSILSNAGLVQSQREGRSIRYFARVDTVQALVTFLLNDCCGGQPAICQPVLAQILDPSSGRTVMKGKTFNVLFLCTANSARSLIAEAILNADPSGRFRAYSAGSQPAGVPNPHTLQLLKRLDYDMGNIRSKSWDEFAGADVPQMDFIFTVCDNAAAESCPVWPGHPVSAHWGVPDPAIVEGSEAEQAAAFNETHRILKARLSLFTSLPFASLERQSLLNRLTEIGKQEV